MIRFVTGATAFALSIQMAHADQIELSLLPELVGYEGEVETNTDGIPIFRLCTGSRGFDYNRIAHVIAASADPDIVDVEVINIGGSWSQLGALSDNRCDGAIIQRDAGVVASQIGAGISELILQGAELHPEFFISVCTRDGSANEFSDMQGRDDTVVIVGSVDADGFTGSGTAVTIRGFQAEDRGYARPTFRYAENLMMAARMIAGGQGDCLAMTSGLGSQAWAEMDARYGEQLRIVEADDGDFNDTRDLGGDRLYEFMDIPGSTETLRNLLVWREGRSPTDRQTVMMRAVYVSRLDYPAQEAADEVGFAAERAAVDFDLKNYGLRQQ